MSLRTFSLYAILAPLLTLAAAERLSCHFKRSDLNRLANAPVLVSSVPPTSELLPAHLLRIQSAEAKNLRVGKILVASRSLGDPLFAKTVILLVQYDADGVLGLTLNRRTKIAVSRVLESLRAAKKRSDLAYLGGPVETPAVFALLKSQAKVENAQSIFDGIYMITAKPLLEQTLATQPDPNVFHVYLGYAGWSQEQLRKEIELGAWFVFPGDVSAVFNADPDSLWQEMIRKTELQIAGNEHGFSPVEELCK